MNKIYDEHGQKRKIYVEPSVKVISLNEQDVLGASNGVKDGHLPDFDHIDVGGFYS